MTSNPFEPPRTTDLESGGDPVTSRLTLSEEATAELIATTPWLRWLARVTSASIAVGLVGAGAELIKSTNPIARMGILFATAVTTMVSTLLLVVWRRYAAASDLLRAGARGAAGQVIDAQASLFRLLGVLLAIAIGLLVVGFGVGYTVGRLGVMR